MAHEIIPELETDRLLLRGFAPSDLDALAATFADPDVMQYIKGGVRSRERVAANIAEYAAEWAEHGCGVWAVVAKSSGLLLGMCGFVEPVELGYILGRAAWGQGIATEAARACLCYGFEQLPYDQVAAGALSENLASRRVLEKLGMRPVPNDYFDRNGGVYYRIARAEHKPDTNPLVARVRGADDDR